jgi:uncharacterized protein YqjF (DUF2071 family)
MRELAAQEAPGSASAEVGSPGRGGAGPAVMEHDWDTLTFIHWAFEPAAVQRLLPPGLRVQRFADASWVGLIPFVLRVRMPAGAPVLPWAGVTLETNVRTYVHGPDGGEGIWFLSLDAARLAAVVMARRWYRLPYRWARMRLRRAGDLLVYESRRRWPGSRGVASVAAVAVGEPVRTGEATELTSFLTHRFRLWSPARGGFARTVVDHPPWPLRRAELVHLEDGLIEAAGLPSPQGPALVHHSEAMHVRFGRRTFVGTERAPYTGGELHRG